MSQETPKPPSSTPSRPNWRERAERHGREVERLKKQGVIQEPKDRLKLVK